MRKIKDLLRVLIIVSVVVLGPVIIHAGEGKALLANRKKAHKCNTCGKEFARKSRLTRHIMIHAGNRPFGCDTCGKRFIEKGNLKRHMVTHTGKKSYRCNICGWGFAQNSHLTRHKNRKNPCKASKEALSVSLARVVSLQADNVVASGNSDSGNQSRWSVKVLPSEDQERVSVPPKPLIQTTRFQLRELLAARALIKFSCH